MLKIHFNKNIVWYDFLSLDKKKLAEIIEKYQINPIISNNFINEKKINIATPSYQNIFLSIDFPCLSNKEFIKNRINIILGKDYFITILNQKNKGIETFKKIFDNGSGFYRGQKQDIKISEIFVYLFEKVYEQLSIELDKIDIEIEKIEKNVFRGNEREMVFEISEINKKLIDFKKYIRNHDDFWSHFFKTVDVFFNQDDMEKLKNIDSAYQKTLNQFEHIKEQLVELRDTNNSLLNVKLHRLSRIFTLTTFSILPITLFVTIITIPTKQKHFFLGHEEDFTSIIIISCILFLSMILISRWKKW